MADVMNPRARKRGLQLDSQTEDIAVGAHGAQRRRVLRGSTSGRAEQHVEKPDEEEDDEYRVSDGEHADGMIHFALRDSQARARTVAARKSSERRQRFETSLYAAGSEAGDSLDDCDPVPSDELLDLVDECSASESEVRTARVAITVLPCCGAERDLWHREAALQRVVSATCAYRAMRTTRPALPRPRTQLRRSLCAHHPLPPRLPPRSRRGRRPIV